MEATPWGSINKIYKQYEQLDSYSDFRVERTWDMLELWGSADEIKDPSHWLPDHTMLLNKLDLSPFVNFNNSAQDKVINMTASFVKYEDGNVSENVMSEVIQ